jgi:hypothetical protein
MPEPEKPNMIPIDHDKPRKKFLGLTLPQTPEEAVKEHVEQGRRDPRGHQKTQGTFTKDVEYSKDAISERAMPSYLLNQMQTLGGFSTNPEVRDKANATIRMQQEKDSEVMAWGSGSKNWSKDDLKNLKSKRLQDLKKVDEKNNLIGTGENDTREQKIFFSAVKNQSNRTSSISQDTDRQGKLPQEILPTTSFNTFPLNTVTGIPAARFANSVKPETTLKGFSKSVKDIFNYFSNPKQQNSLMPTPSVGTEEKAPSPAPTPTEKPEQNQATWPRQSTTAVGFESPELSARPTNQATWPRQSTTAVGFESPELSNRPYVGKKEKELAPTPAPTPTQNNTGSIANIPTPPAIGQDNIKDQTRLTQSKPLISTPASIIPGVVRGAAAAGLGIFALIQALRGPVTKPPPVVPKPVPVPVPPVPVPVPVPPDPTKPDPTKPDPNENPEDEIRRRKKEEEDKKRPDPKPVDPKPVDPKPEEETRTDDEPIKEPKPEDKKEPPPPKKEEPPKKEKDPKKPNPMDFAMMLPTQGNVSSFPSMVTGIPTHSAPSFEKTQLEINYYSELGF